MLKTTLNRPELLNSLDESLTFGLVDAMHETKTDRAVRAVVVTGAVPAFCAGADLNARSWSEVNGVCADEETAANMERGFDPLIKAVAQSTKPVETAINSIAADGGVGLALAGDFAIAAETAEFELVFGPRLDMGASWFVPSLIGRARANGLALLGNNLSASDAEVWGLIWDCVADEDLGSVDMNQASRLADGPTAGLKAVVTAHDRAFSNTLSEQLEDGKKIECRLFDFPHVGESIRAFAEKRKPNFRDVS